MVDDIFLIDSCHEYGITLNRKKFIVATPIIIFGSYILSKDGISGDAYKASVIKSDSSSMLPRPGESSGRLHPRHRHHCTASTYSDKSHSFIWTHVKKTLISPPILAPFNPSLPAMHQTDASHLYGIRYALLQGYDQRQICLVQCLLLPDGSCARIH